MRDAKFNNYLWEGTGKRIQLEAESSKVVSIVFISFEKLYFYRWMVGMCMFSMIVFIAERWNSSKSNKFLKIRKQSY